MKPSKNRVFCKNCGRFKMFFETEKKADNFIAFNKEEIEQESGVSPQRSYFCLFCGGWHTTSSKEWFGGSKNELIVEEFLKKTAISSQKLVSSNTPKTYDIKRNELITELENQVKAMDNNQMEIFFSEKIGLLNKEIADLCTPLNELEIAKLKELRQTLENVYIVRKRNGFLKSPRNNEELNRKESDEWRMWLEKRGYNIE